MRLRGISPIVLLLCFLVVGAAAFALGRRSARGRRVRLNVDYFAGLDHLVNDRFDRATEIFTRLATKSQEAEIQFALGSLMRKRGEVDRAIAIHMGLSEHRELPIREQATFALGLDYMSAGLLDRAEEKLRGLMPSAKYRPAVLERLAWVYEQQRDWRAALDIWRELPPETQRERAAVAAHYCCELGEAALAAREYDVARAHLAAAQGDEAKALDLYVAALAGSRSIRSAFAAEAHEALRGKAAELDQRLRAQPFEDAGPVPEPARFRCDQCGVSSVTWHWRCPGCRSWDSLQSVNNHVH